MKYINSILLVAIILRLGYALTAADTNATNHAEAAAPPAPAKTNAAPVSADTNGPIKLQSAEAAKVIPNPQPTFADGVRWGATAARRNPDLWDVSMLMQISIGLFNADLREQASAAAHQQQSAPAK